MPSIDENIRLGLKPKAKFRITGIYKVQYDRWFDSHAQLRRYERGLKIKAFFKRIFGNETQSKTK